ncbi:phenylalanine--tRNA ligase subunit beta [bacterium]|nr:phenylalanine--tRNA ligase subunit beta [bacterium]
MPVIGISVKRLHELLKSDVSEDRVEQLLDWLGCDVDGVAEVRRLRSRHSDYVIELKPQETIPLSDPHSGFSSEQWQDVWEEVGSERQVLLELLPVRPDLFDAGGLARALRGYLGIETGLRNYEPQPSGWRCEVDHRITNPKYGRPLVQMAVIRNLKIDDNMLRSIMKLQEGLHWALCRDRKFASIGAYDLDKLTGPIHYTLVDPDSFRFTPLFWAHREPVSPRTMLEEHKKGMEYARLLEGLDAYPALLDKAGNVLSLPPVINAEETKVTADTVNFLVDVTGPNEPIVTRALSILASSMVEMDPTGQATLETVEIVYPDHAELTPAMATEQFSVDPGNASRLLGIELDRADCTRLLGNMRHAVGNEAGDGPLSVTVPAYRNDIMHEVDLIEDIAIAYGYHNITHRLVPSFTVGRSLPLVERGRLAAEALCGLGFSETLSLVLTNERWHFERMRIPEDRWPRRVEIDNPAHVDQTMMRTNLHSSLLEQFSRNTDNPLPQRIFEVGDIVSYFGVPDDRAHPRELRVAAAAICSVRTGYAEGRSVMDALLHEMGLDPAKFGINYDEGDYPAALPGRCAELWADAELLGERAEYCNLPVLEGSMLIGRLFEVHPEVLENWKLGNPVVLLELVLGEHSWD